jgi:hypothetical protein
MNSGPSGIDEDVFWVKINIDDLSVSNDDVVLALGYSGNKPQMQPGLPEARACLPDRQVIELIDMVLSKLVQYCEIQAGYRFLDVHVPAGRKDGLYIGNTFFNMREIVTGRLRKSEKAALFICSIGPGMENWSKQLLQSRETLLSYVVDAVASIVVENAVDFLHNHLSDKVKRNGLKITNRYSPGYCDWPVSEQHLLFSLLPENFCGVSLTESSLMLPIKSISGVVGIGSSVKRKDYTCDKCRIIDCTYRSRRPVGQRKKLKADN